MKFEQWRFRGIFWIACWLAIIAGFILLLGQNWTGLYISFAGLITYIVVRFFVFRKS